jgi:hypothetical protein
VWSAAVVAGCWSLVFLALPLAAGGWLLALSRFWSEPTSIKATYFDNTRRGWRLAVGIFVGLAWTSYMAY